MKDILSFLKDFIKFDGKSQVIILLITTNLFFCTVIYKFYNNDIDLYTSKSKLNSNEYSKLEIQLRQQHNIVIDSLMKENAVLRRKNVVECDSLVSSTLDLQLKNYKKLYKRVSELEYKLYIANERVEELTNRVK